MIEFTEGDRNRLREIADCLDQTPYPRDMFHANFLRKLAERPAGDAEDIWQPRAGEMHPVDKAFHKVTVKERDYERVRADRFERERDEARSALLKATSEVPRLTAERDEAPAGDAEGLREAELLHPARVDRWRAEGLRGWLGSEEAVTIAAGALSANYLNAPSQLPDEFGESAITTNQTTAKAGATRVIRALLAAAGGPS